MKILIVGLGSIGRRHLKNLEGVKEIELAALSTGKGILKGDVPIRTFSVFSDALAFKPDGVIVANPTALHCETALPFLESGSRVLIEKPVASEISDAMLLKSHASNLRVAYCMRFMPSAAIFRNEILPQQPFKVSFKRSFYLPKWHPYADYRKEYTARKILGGGVIRTLSHEIDLACSWFGRPISVNGVMDKVSHLELDVDDYAFFSIKTPSGARVNFELDFFSPQNINASEAFTREGKYHWDASRIIFSAYDETEPRTYSELGDSISIMYQEQTLDFLRFVEQGVSMNATLDEAITVLDIIGKVEGQSYPLGESEYENRIPYHSPVEIEPAAEKINIGG